MACATPRSRGSLSIRRSILATATCSARSCGSHRCSRTIGRPRASMIDIMKHVWAVLLVVGTAQAAPAKPPHGATKISIDYTWQSFSHDERHYTLAWDGTRYVSDKKKPIDGALVAALYASLTTTRETSDQMQCISH